MYAIPIERGKIREFATAVQSAHPAHVGPDAVVPPTFLTTAMLAWEPEELNSLASLGFDLPRLLHGEEEYVFHGPPPRAGQELTVSYHVTDRFEKEGGRGGTMRFATVVHEFRDAEGTLVAEQRTTAIETAAR